MAGKWFARCWRLVIILVLGSLPLSSVLGSGTWQGNAPDEAWTHPADRTLNDLGIPYSGQVDMRSDRNFDCAELSYHLLDDLSQTTQTGCFSSTAFGLLDTSHDVAIFNGSSEGEPIHLGSTSPALSALPFSAGVASFSGFPINGTYLHLYSYFPNALQNGRDLTFHRYKQIISSPDMTLADAAGQPIPVNPLALAYSARGEWLVTESPEHALIRVNLATFNVLPFAPPFDVAGEPYASHQAQLTISDDGRYVAVASSEFSSFKVYDLASCSAGNSADDLAPQTCQSYNYWPYVRSQVVGTLAGISHVRFVNDGLLSFDAGDASGANTYELSPSGSITSLISYLGMGDSYASGQGAGDYLEGTDTDNDSCHLSSHSYPLLLNADVFKGAGHSVACTGATINDVGTTSATYTGQTKDQRSAASREKDGSNGAITTNFTPGYLSQQTFVRDYQPGVLTVEIGGNDVGFRDILISCVSPLAAVNPVKVNPNNCYESYEDRLELEQTIARNYQKWVALYKQLRETAPAAKVYALGYPQIVSSQGACGLNVRLSSSEILFTQEIIDYINATIVKAAAAAGIQYVDISHALDGHRLCEASGSATGMNGLTAGTDVYGVLSKESYHPNALGQELMEQAILKATHNFTDTVSTPASSLPPPIPSDSDPLLTAPKSGRTISTVLPDEGIARDSAVRGSSLTITVNGLSDGLLPGSAYVITLGDGTGLGTLTADNNGNLSGSLSIPATATAGDQTILIAGQNTSGDPLVVTKTIYVDSSSDDYDGDGIANKYDSCPNVTNSATDADRDGIDDACDPIIGNGSSTGQGNSQTPDTISSSSGINVGYQSEDTTVITLGNGADTKQLAKAGSESIVANLSSAGVGRLIGNVQAAYSPQQASNNIHLAPSSSKKLIPSLSRSPHQQLLPLKIIRWLPWLIGWSLSLLLLLLMLAIWGRSSYTGQDDKTVRHNFSSRAKRPI